MKSLPLLSLLIINVGALSLNLLHMNDFHCRFESVSFSGSPCKSSCFGGIARIKYLVDTLKDNSSIFLNAGDLFQGTVWYTMYKWSIVSNLTSSLSITASSLGNHEFDDGVNDLIEFSKNIPYPLLACNLDLSLEPALKDAIQSSIVVQIHGVPIGIIGYVTPETKILSSTRHVIFKDEIESLKEEVSKLQAQGIKILIALGHSGIDKDLEIAREVSGISVVVGGHTNSLLWNGPNLVFENEAVVGPYPTVVMKKENSEEKTLILQTNGYGRILGSIQLVYNDVGTLTSYSTSNPLILNEKVKEDEDLRRLVISYGDKIKERMSTVVGSSLETIDGERRVCRLRECEIGNMVTDAMRAEMKVPIAIFNSGGIKGSLEEGNITMGDILSVLPWSNTVDIVTISGATLMALFEHSVFNYESNSTDPSGQFLQVSGLKVSYNINQPAGFRVESIRSFDSEKLVDPRESYDVAVMSFMVHGGDGYSMLPHALLQHKNTGFLDNDLFLSYIQKKNIVRKPVGGRIVIQQLGSKAIGSAQTYHHSYIYYIIMITAVLLHSSNSLF